MQNAPLPEVKLPWIVGREPLLEFAAEDFLGEVTRQTPWVKARYEDLFGRLDLFLDPEGGALLAALTPEREAAWLATLDGEEGPLAGRMLADFRAYLRDWGWIAA